VYEVNDTSIITTDVAGRVDGAAWLERWDRQQEAYMANREERFGVILDAVGHAAGTTAPVVLDLCCGPGSLGVRVLDRFPDARVAALDNDPVLMLLGRRAYGNRGGRLTWVAADLRSSDWTATVAVHGPFDAVVSTTALHWLGLPTLASTYLGVAGLLRPGGVFVNGDHLHEPRQPRLMALQTALRRLPNDDRELWGPWWAALEAASASDVDLTNAFAERVTRDAHHPETSNKPAFDAHVAVLRDAGLTDVGTVWQHGDDRVLVAFRPE
jgi:trans-aconitate methyltransferase